MNPQQQLEKVRSKISPELAAELAQRLQRFAKAAQPVKTVKTTNLVLVRRPGLPPRPLNSTYFVCRTLS